MDDIERKSLRLKSEEFARENIKECSIELLEWHDEAVLRDGKIRELARLCKVWCGDNSLRIAERLIERKALEFVVENS